MHMRRWAVMALAMLAGAGMAQAEDAMQSSEGFVPMFDGETLDGWDTTGNWKVKDNGVVTLEPRPGEEGWQRFDAYLTTERTYKDFILELDFKIREEGNSGVFLRVGDPKSPVETGMEVQILDTHGMENPGHHDCGGLIGIAGPSKNMAKPAGEWNHYRIKCVGNQLEVELNGEEIHDLNLNEATDRSIPAEGYIAFQDEAKPVWYRNVRIKELKPDQHAADSGQGWVELFDGESLDGWIQKNGTATYRVEEDAIVGRTSPGSPNSFLCTEKDYGDFELRFEVKLFDDELNSGVQIRSKTKPPEGDERFGRVNGPQVEIEANTEEGSESGYIYGEAAGGWMTPDDERALHKVFKNGEWNEYRVVAKGPRIRTWINGQPIEDLTDHEKYETHPKGFIGLQVHGVGDRGPFEVAWRNIRIRELD